MRKPEARASSVARADSRHGQQARFDDVDDDDGDASHVGQDTTRMWQAASEKRRRRDEAKAAAAAAKTRDTTKVRQGEAARAKMHRQGRGGHVPAATRGSEICAKKSRDSRRLGRG